ncbi:unnamed protein product [Tetraodon nigroviridis]|uniref:(spotted green pufferfish) hypothetical protein n=1 Tax=Tetraodon nigroviridis TaxID=99883 RepID=Q4S3G3_TETNG|nr:unnamed protein product [Tetraodon nigroviridis]
MVVRLAAGGSDHCLSGLALMHSERRIVMETTLTDRKLCSEIREGDRGCVCVRSMDVIYQVNNNACEDVAQVANLEPLNGLKLDQ